MGDLRVKWLNERGSEGKGRGCVGVEMAQGGGQME